MSILPERQKSRSTDLEFDEQTGVNTITHQILGGDGVVYEFTIELQITECTLYRPTETLLTKESGEFTRFKSPVVRIDKIGPLIVGLDVRID